MVEKLMNELLKSRQHAMTESRARCMVVQVKADALSWSRSGETIE